MRIAHSIGVAALAAVALVAATATAPVPPRQPAVPRSAPCSCRRTPSRATRSSATTGSPTARCAWQARTRPAVQGIVLDGSVVDHLASQSSLARDGSTLFAVNGGSDSITSFTIARRPAVNRQTIGSWGDAPVSIAAHGHQVFVLNARGGGSIQGYLTVAGHLLAGAVVAPQSGPRPERDAGVHPHAGPDRVHPGRIEAHRVDQGQHERLRRVPGRPSRALGLAGRHDASRRRAVRVPVRRRRSPHHERGRHELGRIVRGQPRRHADPARERGDRPGGDLLDRRQRPVRVRLERRQRDAERLPHRRRRIAHQHRDDIDGRRDGRRARHPSTDATSTSRRAPPEWSTSSASARADRSR